MKLSTKQKLRRALYPIAGILVGVAEVIQQDQEFYLRSWQELATRAVKALPFVFFGFVARTALLSNPPVDNNKKNLDT